MSGTQIQLLWTGGWDSTFRILESSLFENSVAHPHYVVDPGRPSTATEISTIKKITQRANERAGRQAIFPVQIVDRRSLSANDRVTAAHKELVKLGPLGTQYDWLARFAFEYDISPLELAIHRDDKAYRFVKGDFGHPEAVETVFGRFSFPVLDLSKRDMKALAQERGYLDLLEMSWFCHGGGKQPCGYCGPCSDAMREGMEYRLHSSAKLRYHVRRAVGPVYDFAARAKRAVLPAT